MERIDHRMLADNALQLSAVTGGGSGIGFAFAKACHEKGARVLIGDLKLTDEADQYVSKVKDSSIVFQKCDVSSWDDLHDLISTSVKKFSAVPDVYAPIVRPSRA
jgi:NAD(P)-dependent dehydrogenase (short-subunit alcohol dehydrogenase family)